MQPTTDSRLATVRAHLVGTADVLKQTFDQCGPAILAAADLVAESFRKGGKLMICGNGGSAADCQHLAAEFTSRLTIDFPRPALPALAVRSGNFTSFSKFGNASTLFGKAIA